MSRTPLITFKAGRCEMSTGSRPYKVKANPEPGYIFLYEEDDLTHFCWRPRAHPVDETPPLDLLMVPGDGRFVPYQYETSEQPTSKTNGRIFVLRFFSSSQRYLFWLQSKPQASDGDASWISPRDRKICDIVDRILQGDVDDVSGEVAAIRSGQHGGDDDDETMEDVEGRGDPSDHHQGGTGGAGPDATGGDVRREGEDAREGGADGARAASGGATDAATVVQNFLNSLKGAGMGGGGGAQQQQGKVYPLLSDLLDTPTTIPVIETAPEAYIDTLISFLPPVVLALAIQEDEDDVDGVDAETAQAALSLEQKKALLRQVLRSPQFHQSLTSLTMALRDGGLPTIAEALGVRVDNGGLVRGGSVPMGGGDAVEAFVEGVKKTVQEEGSR